ncbi:EGF-like module-containing mucin-like hormone receptor-like 4 [Aix galericulata]|nr:EGF-like module-containing mucin-like hormone receptor-like 4 [Aix galericulata]
MMSLQTNESYALRVVSYVGLSVSLLCLFLTIVTFVLCRSLWSLLCKIVAGCLHYFFLASFSWMLLEGLHLFLTVRNLRVLNYLSTNRFKRRYLYPVGYGLPAIVVAASAATRPDGYGAKEQILPQKGRPGIWARVFSTPPKPPRGGRGVFLFFPFFCPFSCWLNTMGGFSWSFVGPVCVIILVGVLLQKRGKNWGEKRKFSHL